MNEKTAELDKNNPVMDNDSDRLKLLKEIDERQKRLSYINTNRRIISIIGLVFFIVGVFCWMQQEFISEFFISDWNGFNPKDREHIGVASNVKLFGSFFLLIATVIVSYLYMVGFNPQKERSKELEGLISGETNRENLEIIALLKSIDRSLEKGKLESVLSELERAEIISKIGATVETQLNETLLMKIEEKYGLKIHSDKLSRLAETNFSTTITRLNKYADDLKNKASVNLAYGIAATISAIIVLIFILFNASPPGGYTQTAAIFYYTSRLFLVVLVQGISIFFLNLYKTTLNNILYINNEITNHESKRDSLSIALSSGDLNSATEILKNLSNTERNFILKSGETSIFDKGGSQMTNPLSQNIISELISKIPSK